MKMYFSKLKKQQANKLGNKQGLRNKKKVFCMDWKNEQLNIKEVYRNRSSLMWVVKTVLFQCTGLWCVGVFWSGWGRYGNIAQCIRREIIST